MLLLTRNVWHRVLVVYVVLQHAKSSVTMKLHVRVCVHILGVPQFMIHSR